MEACAESGGFMQRPRLVVLYPRARKRGMGVNDSNVMLGRWNTRVLIPVAQESRAEGEKWNKMTKRTRSLQVQSRLGLMSLMQLNLHAWHRVDWAFFSPIFWREPKRTRKSDAQSSIHLCICILKCYIRSCFLVIFAKCLQLERFLSLMHAKRVAVLAFQMNLKTANVKLILFL